MSGIIINEKEDYSKREEMFDKTDCLLSLSTIYVDKSIFRIYYPNY